MKTAAPKNPASSRGSGRISGVPNYPGYRGCSPTAAGMVLGYWDSHGYPNFPNGTEGRTLIDELEDAMGTWDWPIHGFTWPLDIDNGIEEVCENHGYSNFDASNDLWMSWSEVKDEVDASRPFVISMLRGGTGSDWDKPYGEHSVTCVGYDDYDEDYVPEQHGVCHLHVILHMFKSCSYTLFALTSPLFGSFFNGEIHISVGVITPTRRSKGTGDMSLADIKPQKRVMDRLNLSRSCRAGDIRLLWLITYNLDFIPMNRQNLLWRIIPLRGCIREIADFLAINIIVEPRSATYLERYVTTGKCLILSTDEALDANEAVNSYQERDDHREVVSHPEDVGGTSLAKQVCSHTRHMGRTGAYLSVWQLVGSNGNMGDTMITHFYFFTKFIFYRSQEMKNVQEQKE